MHRPFAIKSVRDQITDSLRADVLCGRISAGSRLSETNLAERFGVSRGPVREALSQLTHEGLLISKPNCGVTVAPMPTDEIRDLIVPLRRTIETYALKLFFPHLTERDFFAFEEILGRLELACRQGDEKEIVLEDIAFHRLIITRADHLDLLAIWQTILVRVRGHFYDAVHRNRDRLLEVVKDHRRLLSTFRQGDLDLAVAALSDHIW